MERRQLALKIVASYPSNIWPEYSRTITKAAFLLQAMVQLALLDADRNEPIIIVAIDAVIIAPRLLNALNSL